MRNEGGALYGGGLLLFDFLGAVVRKGGKFRTSSFSLSWGDSHGKRGDDRGKVVLR